MLNTLVWLVVFFKPVHVLQTEGVSCGAADRLLHERVKIAFPPTPHEEKVYVNGMPWEVLPSIDQALLYDVSGMDADNEGWGWALKYQVHDDQYMSMEIIFNDQEAYLSIQGIDAKRRPCQDGVYLRRLH